jgi:hypothetical protein
MKGRITGDKYVKYMLCILFDCRNVAKWYYLCTKFHANLLSGSKVINGGGGTERWEYHRHIRLQHPDKAAVAWTILSTKSDT